MRPRSARKPTPRGALGPSAPSHRPACDAFTLVEVLVTISIIAVLAMFLLVGVKAGLTSSKTETTRALLAQVGMACEQFREIRERYPQGSATSSQALPAELGSMLKVKQSFIPNIDSVPTLVDAWGRPITYVRYLSDQVPAPGPFAPGAETTEGCQPVHNIKTFDLFSCGRLAGKIPGLGNDPGDLAAYQTKALLNSASKYQCDQMPVDGQVNYYIGNW